MYLTATYSRTTFVSVSLVGVENDGNELNVMKKNLFSNTKRMMIDSVLGLEKKIIVLETMHVFIVWKI